MIISLLFLFIFPIVIGNLFGECRGWGERFFAGAMIILSSFGVCYYVLIFLIRNNSIDLLSQIYHVILALLLFVSILKMLKNGATGIKSTLRINQLFRNKDYWYWGTFLLISYQMLRLILGTPIQMRDSVVYNQAVFYMTKWGRVYSSYGVTDFSPSQLITIEPKFITTPWYVFEAYLARITGLHSLIVTNTLIPTFVLLLSYIALYLLATELFQGDNKRIYVFLFFCALLYDSRTILGEQSAFFLIWPAWGKSVVSSVVCTATAAWIIRCNRNEKNTLVDCILFAILSFVGTMCSAAAMMAIPVEIGAMTLAYMYVKRSGKPILFAMYGIVPCIIQFMVYKMYTSGMLNGWLMGASA